MSGGGGAEGVSVVVPTVGRPVLREVVDACLAQDPREVLVVADRDEAGVRALLAGARVGSAVLRVLRGAGRGPAEARAEGVRAATGDVVLMLDDDVVPDPGLLAGHAAAHAGTTGRAVVGFMPVGTDCRARSATAAIYDGDYRRGVAEIEAGAPVLTQLWAGNVSLRRTDALRTPPADPEYRYRWREDQNYGLRLAEAGLVGVFVRALGARHRYERTAAEFLEISLQQRLVDGPLRALHPQLPPAAPAAAGLPAPLATVVVASGLPAVGGAIAAVVKWIAVRLGDGPPRRWRTGLLVLARGVVQHRA